MPGDRSSSQGNNSQPNHSENIEMVQEGQYNTDGIAQATPNLDQQPDVNDHRADSSSGNCQFQCWFELSYFKHHQIIFQTQPNQMKLVLNMLN